MVGSLKSPVPFVDHKNTPSVPLALAVKLVFEQIVWSKPASAEELAPKESTKTSDKLGQAPGFVTFNVKVTVPAFTSSILGV